MLDIKILSETTDTILDDCLAVYGTSSIHCMEAILAAERR
jgi:hypothetical protein